MMQEKLLKIVLPVFAALLLGVGGNAFAANTSMTIDADRTLSQAQPPVDCKKKPDDPRCKDQKK